MFASIMLEAFYALSTFNSIKLLLVKNLDFPHLHYCGSVTKDMTVELSDIDGSRITVSGFVFGLKCRDHVTPFYNEVFILRLNPVKSN